LSWFKCLSRISLTLDPLRPYLCLRLSFHLIFSLCLISFIWGCHSNPYRQGHQLYQVHCESCHMEDGGGLAKLIPSLASSNLFSSPPDRLICLIRNGLDKNEATGQQMPANPLLNEVEMANLVNYLRQVYSSGAIAVKTQEVKTYLANCKPD